MPGVNGGFIRAFEMRGKCNTSKPFPTIQDTERQPNAQMG